MSLDAHLGVTLGTFTLDVVLDAPAGSVLAVLGPNGAGKTTCLRALAGTVRLDHGHLTVAGRDLDRPGSRVFVEPASRRVGHVPQDLLLFPHLSAVDNVAFGPRSRGAGRADSRATARAWLDRVGLAAHADVRPGRLSGGQAQRVALARALAADPEVLVLDEPLAALDAGTRNDVRRDLRRHLDGFAGVAVVVTHDPLDALLLADRVVVLEDGRATQSGTVAEVTSRPRSTYVATLMGTNLFTGTGHGHAVHLDGASLAVADAVDGPVFATVSPRAVTLHTDRPHGSARNVWPATVSEIDLLGERVRVHLDGAPPIVAEVTPPAVAELGLQVGSGTWVSVKATEVDTYPTVAPGGGG